MRCSQCGYDPGVDNLIECPRCRATMERRAPAPAKPDEEFFESHTHGHVLGRARPAHLDEGNKREDFYRPDAVLAIIGTVPADLSAFEAHVANLIDGVRPVARIRKKAGVSSADLRIALGGLCDRGCVRLAGIVEQAAGPLADQTSAGKNKDVIPSHVMAEIQSMLDEDDAADELRGLDEVFDETDGITRK